MRHDMEQADEIRLREAVAQNAGADLLSEVGRHHSIGVMDREVRRFLAGVARGGVIIDVGGGWGWHWRHLGAERPDVCVVVVDFVRANLALAARLLGPLVDVQVHLVHGDATRLPFPAGVFDGYWSVQALQHIARFEQAVCEAHRVLRAGGSFACYSLNRAPLIEGIYRIAGRSYHVRGPRPGSFYLARAASTQARVVSRVFGSPVVNRYTEVLFHPDLGLHTGRAGSRLGTLDACCSSSVRLLAGVARQRSYHTRKPS